MRVLHLADIHAREKDFVEVSTCMNSIVVEAYEIKPDLIAIAGDCFDSQEIKLDSNSTKMLFQMLAGLADVAPVIIVMGTPSHDGNAPLVFQHIKAKYEIYISHRPEVLFLAGSKICLEPDDMAPYKPELIISTTPTPTKQYFRTDAGVQESDALIAEALTDLFISFGSLANQFDCPHIHVGHYQVGGAYISDTQQLIGRDIEISIDQISLAQADLVCLGHIHKPQQIGKNVFYSGSIFRKDWGELEDKGFYVHEIHKKGGVPFSRFIKTPTRKLFKTELDKTQGDISGDLAGVPEAADIKDAFVKIAVKIYRDDVPLFNSKLIKQFYLDAGAQDVKIELIQIPRENVRSANFITLRTTGEKLTEQAEIKNEEIPAGVLEKVERLETEPADKIIDEVTKL